MSNPVVNVPPVGPAVPPPYGTSVAPYNPYQNLASNIGAYINSKAHGSVKAWGFGQLSALVLFPFGNLGAGLTGSAISGAIILPQYCKIPKVAVAYKTCDVFNGSETLNIVVESSGDYNANASTPNERFNTTGTPFGAGSGFGASYTAGIAQTTGPGDNSGDIGYPSQFAAVGTCLFGTDIGFSSSYFTGNGAGTSGGNEVFPTTEWDTVYAAGSILSLRAVTTASTGSITDLMVVLLVQYLDKFPSNDRAIPCYAW